MFFVKTEVLSAKDIGRAISLLKEGMPIAFPTETVYGLGAPVFDRDAIQKVFEIKGRPSDNPLIVHVSSMDQVGLIGEDLPPFFFELANQYWPGPLTLVVPKKKEVPGIVTAGLNSVAIRMPSHPIAQKLIDEVGPLVAPSANLSGCPSPTSFLDVLEDLDGKIPAVIDGGRCSVGIESTVLSLTGDVPTLLRPGVIELEAAAPSSKTPIASPGMKYRHYAPKAKVLLVDSLVPLRGSLILSTEPKQGMRLLNEHTLYHELRRADREGVRQVLIEVTPTLRKNKALMNRLEKASGKNS